MLVSVYADLGPSEPVSTWLWQPGDPILVEVDGAPVRTAVIRVDRAWGNVTGLFLQVELPVPLGRWCRSGDTASCSAGC